MNDKNYFCINLPIDVLRIDTNNFDSELLKTMRIQNKISNIHILNKKINYSHDIFFSRINCINKLKVNSNRILTEKKNCIEEKTELNRKINDISKRIKEINNRIQNYLNNTNEINNIIEKEKSSIMFIEIKTKDLRFHIENIIPEKGQIESSIKDYKRKIYQLNKEIHKLNLQKIKNLK